MDKTEIFQERIVNIFDKYLGNDYLLLIFGSYTKGTKTISSDIDLAVYMNKKIPAYLIVQIKDDIERKVGTLRDVDVIDLCDENIDLGLLQNILTAPPALAHATNFSSMQLCTCAFISSTTSPAIEVSAASLLNLPKFKKIISTTMTKIIIPITKKIDSCPFLSFIL